MISFWFMFIIYNTIIHISCDKVSPIVQTQLGGIRGTYKQSFSGREYECYEGIPYALPPILKRRFEPPEPIEAWVGNLSATKLSSVCLQFTHEPFSKFGDRVQGSEDCLYLNVYVPVHDRHILLPVVFDIHGGAYQFGSAETGAKFLMDRDIILVTFNYRLGIFGFLSTQDDVVPGNMGLKDQSLALRWVSENIEYFGGDPKRITLMGNSAGGASVHYHYLSPMSRGLFQNGISFSGTVFGPGKQTEHAQEKAKKLASILGCPIDQISTMIECLRLRPARSIAETTNHFMPFLYNPFTPFGPVIEKHGNKPFINRNPINIIESGDISDALWITSLVSEEGLYPGAEFIESEEHLKILDETWSQIAPHLLDYNFTIPKEKHAEVAKAIRKHYLGSMPINKVTIDPLIAMIGDRLYAVDSEKAARLQAKVNKKPVLFLYYSYRALTSYSDYYTKSKRDYGVSHYDDVCMIFENIFIDPTKRLEDRAVQMKLIDMIVSVAERGHPDLNLGFEWKKVDPTRENLEFLHIAGSNNIKMNSDYNLGQKLFWATIDFNENKL